MRHLVFLLEEPSAQDALQAWLPSWLPAEVTPHFIVFQGKQDLEKRMVLRMRHWLQPDSRFLVLRDQDSGDCKVVKAALVERCAAAGRPDAVVRVACRELESFFVGDWRAVAQAFSKPALARLAGKAMYRNPDSLGSPSRELAKHLSGYQKRDGARRISPLVDPMRSIAKLSGVAHGGPGLGFGMKSTQRSHPPASNSSQDVSGAGLDVQAVLAALRRVALEARRIAQQTGTDLIAMRDGKVVRVPPEQVGRHRGGGG